MEVAFEVVDGVFFVYLKGRLSYEWVDAFRLECNRFRSGKVIFNLSQLSFVGSNGINEFIATLKDLYSDELTELRVCGVASEFQRVFSASPLKDMEIYEDGDEAHKSMKIPRDKLFFEPSRVPWEFQEKFGLDLEKIGSLKGVKKNQK